MNFTEVDKLKVISVIDNYYNSLSLDPPCGKRLRISYPFNSVHAEHGLSFFIEACAEGRKGSLMFDFGTDSQVLINNMNLLNISFLRVDSLALSHGHFDHWGGLLGFLRFLAPKIWNKISLHVGEKIFTRRFSIRPGKVTLTDLRRLKKKDIERLGKFEVVEIKDISEPIKGVYLAGKIEMTTDYEKIPETLLVKRAGKLEHDDFSDEIVLFSIIKRKGLVIISGCAHRGIVNTVKHVQKITEIKKVHAIIGGFHLINVKPEVIEKTVRDLKAISPDYVIPMHCTGFEALRLFAQEMPNQFILNTVGTTYEFCSSSKIKSP